MANEELVEKSFKKISNTHYECVYCAAQIKSSGLLRRCAHLAGISLRLGGQLAKGPYLPQTLEGISRTTKAVLGR